MMGVPQPDDDGETAYVAHIAPLLHVEVEAESPVEAQLEAQRRVVDALEETDLEAEELSLEDLDIDHQTMMDGLFEALEEPEVPDEDSVGIDIDGPEESYTFEEEQ